MLAAEDRPDFDPDRGLVVAEDDDAEVSVCVCARAHTVCFAANAWVRLCARALRACLVPYVRLVRCARTLVPPGPPFPFHPTFHLFPAINPAAPQDLELEVCEDEPAFLRGQTRLSRELSPIKVVKNPDGSMQRAAMTQSALAKERKELREQQERQLLDSIPRDLNRPWNDPMGADDRHLAAELRGLGSTFELPEWKQQSQVRVCPRVCVRGCMGGGCVGRCV